MQSKISDGATSPTLPLHAFNFLVNCEAFRSSLPFESEPRHRHRQNQRDRSHAAKSETLNENAAPNDVPLASSVDLERGQVHLSAFAERALVAGKPMIAMLCQCLSIRNVPVDTEIAALADAAGPIAPTVAWGVVHTLFSQLTGLQLSKSRLDAIVATASAEKRAADLQRLKDRKKNDPPFRGAPKQNQRGPHNRQTQQPSTQEDQQNDEASRPDADAVTEVLSIVRQVARQMPGCFGVPPMPATFAQLHRIQKEEALDTKQRLEFKRVADAAAADAAHESATASAANTNAGILGSAPPEAAPARTTAAATGAGVNDTSAPPLAAMRRKVSTKSRALFRQIESDGDDADEESDFNLPPGRNDQQDFNPRKVSAANPKDYAAGEKVPRAVLRQRLAGQQQKGNPMKRGGERDSGQSAAEELRTKERDERRQRRHKLAEERRAAKNRPEQPWDKMPAKGLEAPKREKSTAAHDDGQSGDFRAQRHHPRRLLRDPSLGRAPVASEVGAGGGVEDDMRRLKDQEERWRRQQEAAAAAQIAAAEARRQDGERARAAVALRGFAQPRSLADYRGDKIHRGRGRGGADERFGPTSGAPIPRGRSVEVRAPNVGGRLAPLRRSPSVEPRPAAGNDFAVNRNVRGPLAGNVSAPVSGARKPPPGAGQRLQRKAPHHLPAGGLSHTPQPSGPKIGRPESNQNPPSSKTPEPVSARVAGRKPLPALRSADDLHGDVDVADEDYYSFDRKGRKGHRGSKKPRELFAENEEGSGHHPNDDDPRGRATDRLDDDDVTMNNAALREAAVSVEVQDDAALEHAAMCQPRHIDKDAERRRGMLQRLRQASPANVARRQQHGPSDEVMSDHGQQGSPAPNRQTQLEVPNADDAANDPREEELRATEEKRQQGLRQRAKEDLDLGTMSEFYQKPSVAESPLDAETARKQKLGQERDQGNLEPLPFNPIYKNNTVDGAEGGQETATEQQQLQDSAEAETKEPLFANVNAVSRACVTIQTMMRAKIAQNIVEFTGKALWAARFLFFKWRWTKRVRDRSALLYRELLANPLVPHADADSSSAQAQRSADGIQKFGVQSHIPAHVLAGLRARGVTDADAALLIQRLSEEQLKHHPSRLRSTGPTSATSDEKDGEIGREEAEHVAMYIAATSAPPPSASTPSYLPGLSLATGSCVRCGPVIGALQGAILHEEEALQRHTATPSHNRTHSEENNAAAVGDENSCTSPSNVKRRRGQTKSLDALPEWDLSKPWWDQTKADAADRTAVDARLQRFTTLTGCLQCKTLMEAMIRWRPTASDLRRRRLDPAVVIAQSFGRWRLSSTIARRKEATAQETLLRLMKEMVEAGLDPSTVTASNATSAHQPTEGTAIETSEERKSAPESRLDSAVENEAAAAAAKTSASVDEVDAMDETTEQEVRTEVFETAEETILKDDGAPNSAKDEEVNTEERVHESGAEENSGVQEEKEAGATDELGIDPGPQDDEADRQKCVSVFTAATVVLFAHRLRARTLERIRNRAPTSSVFGLFFTILFAGKLIRRRDNTLLFQEDDGVPQTGVPEEETVEAVRQKRARRALPEMLERALMRVDPPLLSLSDDSNKLDMAAQKPPSKAKVKSEEGDEVPDVHEAAVKSHPIDGVSCWVSIAHPTDHATSVNAANDELGSGTVALADQFCGGQWHSPRPPTQMFCGRCREVLSVQWRRWRTAKFWWPPAPILSEVNRFDDSDDDGQVEEEHDQEKSNGSPATSSVQKPGVNHRGHATALTTDGNVKLDRDGRAWLKRHITSALCRRCAPRFLPMARASRRIGACRTAFHFVAHVLAALFVVKVKRGIAKRRATTSDGVADLNKPAEVCSDPVCEALALRVSAGMQRSRDHQGLGSAFASPWLSCASTATTALFGATPEERVRGEQLLNRRVWPLVTHARKYVALSTCPSVALHVSRTSAMVSPGTGISCGSSSANAVRKIVVHRTWNWLCRVVILRVMLPLIRRRRRAVALGAVSLRPVFPCIVIRSGGGGSVANSSDHALLRAASPSLNAARKPPLQRATANGNGNAQRGRGGGNVRGRGSGRGGGISLPAGRMTQLANGAGRGGFAARAPKAQALAAAGNATGRTVSDAAALEVAVLASVGCVVPLPVVGACRRCTPLLMALYERLTGMITRRSVGRGVDQRVNASDMDLNKELRSSHPHPHRVTPDMLLESYGALCCSQCRALVVFRRANASPIAGLAATEFSSTIRQILQPPAASSGLQVGNGARHGQRQQNNGRGNHVGGAMRSGPVGRGHPNAGLTGRTAKSNTPADAPSTTKQTDVDGIASENESSSSFSVLREKDSVVAAASVPAATFRQIVSALAPTPVKASVGRGSRRLFVAVMILRATIVRRRFALEESLVKQRLAGVLLHFQHRVAGATTSAASQSTAASPASIGKNQHSGGDALDRLQFSHQQPVHHRTAEQKKLSELIKSPDQSTSVAPRTLAGLASMSPSTALSHQRFDGVPEAAIVAVLRREVKAEVAAWRRSGATHPTRHDDAMQVTVNAFRLTDAAMMQEEEVVKGRMRCDSCKCRASCEYQGRCGLMAQYFVDLCNSAAAMHGVWRSLLVLSPFIDRRLLADASSPTSLPQEQNDTVPVEQMGQLWSSVERFVPLLVDKAGVSVERQSMQAQARSVFLHLVMALHKATVLMCPLCRAALSTFAVKTAVPRILRTVVGVSAAIAVMKHRRLRLQISSSVNVAMNGTADQLNHHDVDCEGAERAKRTLCAYDQNRHRPSTKLSSPWSLRLWATLTNAPSSGGRNTDGSERASTNPRCLKCDALSTFFIQTLVKRLLLFAPASSSNSITSSPNELGAVRRLIQHYCGEGTDQEHQEDNAKRQRMTVQPMLCGECRVWYQSAAVVLQRRLFVVLRAVVRCKVLLRRRMALRRKGSAPPTTTQLHAQDTESEAQQKPVELGDFGHPQCGIQRSPFDPIGWLWNRGHAGGGAHGQSTCDAVAKDISEDHDHTKSEVHPVPETHSVPPLQQPLCDRCDDLVRPFLPLRLNRILLNNIESPSSSVSSGAAAPTKAQWSRVVASYNAALCPSCKSLGQPIDDRSASHPPWATDATLQRLGFLTNSELTRTSASGCSSPLTNIHPVLQWLVVLTFRCGLFVLQRRRWLKRHAMKLLTAPSGLKRSPNNGRQSSAAWSVAQLLAEHEQAICPSGKFAVRPEKTVKPAAMSQANPKAESASAATTVGGVPDESATDDKAKRDEKRQQALAALKQDAIEEEKAKTQATAADKQGASTAKASPGDEDDSKPQGDQRTAAEIEAEAKRIENERRAEAERAHAAEEAAVTMNFLTQEADLTLTVPSSISGLSGGETSKAVDHKDKSSRPMMCATSAPLVVATVAGNRPGCKQSAVCTAIIESAVEKAWPGSRVEIMAGDTTTSSNAVDAKSSIADAAKAGMKKGNGNDSVASSSLPIAAVPLAVTKAQAQSQRLLCGHSACTAALQSALLQSHRQATLARFAVDRWRYQGRKHKTCVSSGMRLCASPFGFRHLRDFTSISGVNEGGVVDQGKETAKRNTGEAEPLVSTIDPKPSSKSQMVDGEYIRAAFIGALPPQHRVVHDICPKCSAVGFFLNQRLESLQDRLETLDAEIAPLEKLKKSAGSVVTADSVVIPNGSFTLEAPGPLPSDAFVKSPPQLMSPDPQTPQHLPAMALPPTSLVPHIPPLPIGANANSNSARGSAGDNGQGGNNSVGRNSAGNAGGASVGDDVSAYLASEAALGGANDQARLAELQQERGRLKQQFDGTVKRHRRALCKRCIKAILRTKIAPAPSPCCTHDTVRTSILTSDRIIGIAKSLVSKTAAERFDELDAANNATSRGAVGDVSEELQQRRDAVRTALPTAWKMSDYNHTSTCDPSAVTAHDDKVKCQCSNAWLNLYNAVFALGVTTAASKTSIDDDDDGAVSTPGDEGNQSATNQRQVFALTPTFDALFDRATKDDHDQGTGPTLLSLEMHKKSALPKTQNVHTNAKGNGRERYQPEDLLRESLSAVSKEHEGQFCGVRCQKFTEHWVKEMHEQRRAAVGAVIRWAFVVRRRRNARALVDANPHRLSAPTKTGLCRSCDGIADILALRIASLQKQTTVAEVGTVERHVSWMCTECRDKVGAAMEQHTETLTAPDPEDVGLAKLIENKGLNFLHCHPRPTPWCKADESSLPNEAEKENDVNPEGEAAHPHPPCHAALDVLHTIARFVNDFAFDEGTESRDLVDLFSSGRITSKTGKPTDLVLGVHISNELSQNAKEQLSGVSPALGDAGAPLEAGGGHGGRGFKSEAKTARRKSKSGLPSSPSHDQLADDTNAADVNPNNGNADGGVGAGGIGGGHASSPRRRLSVGAEVMVSPRPQDSHELKHQPHLLSLALPDVPNDKCDTVRVDWLFPLPLDIANNAAALTTGLACLSDNASHDASPRRRPSIAGDDVAADGGAATPGKAMSRQISPRSNSGSSPQSGVVSPRSDAEVHEAQETALQTVGVRLTAQSVVAAFQLLVQRRMKISGGAIDNPRHQMQWQDSVSPYICQDCVNTGIAHQVVAHGFSWRRSAHFAICRWRWKCLLWPRILAFRHDTMGRNDRAYARLNISEKQKGWKESGTEFIHGMARPMSAPFCGIVPSALSPFAESAVGAPNAHEKSGAHDGSPTGNDASVKIQPPSASPRDASPMLSGRRIASATKRRSILEVRKDREKSSAFEAEMMRACGRCLDIQNALGTRLHGLALWPMSTRRWATTIKKRSQAANPRVITPQMAKAIRRRYNKCFHPSCHTKLAIADAAADQAKGGNGGKLNRRMTTAVRLAEAQGVPLEQVLSDPNNAEFQNGNGNQNQESSRQSEVSGVPESGGLLCRDCLSAVHVAVELLLRDIARSNDEDAVALNSRNHFHTHLHENASPNRGGGGKLLVDEEGRKEDEYYRTKSKGDPARAVVTKEQAKQQAKSKSRKHATAAATTAQASHVKSKTAKEKSSKRSKDTEKHRLHQLSHSYLSSTCCHSCMVNVSLWAQVAVDRAVAVRFIFWRWRWVCRARTVRCPPLRCVTVDPSLTPADSETAISDDATAEKKATNQQTADGQSNAKADQETKKDGQAAKDQRGAPTASLLRQAVVKQQPKQASKTDKTKSANTAKRLDDGSALVGTADARSGRTIVACGKCTAIAQMLFRRLPFVTGEKRPKLIEVAANAGGDLLPLSAMDIADGGAGAGAGGFGGRNLHRASGADLDLMIPETASEVSGDGGIAPSPASVSEPWFNTADPSTREHQVTLLFGKFEVKMHKSCLDGLQRPDLDAQSLRLFRPWMNVTATASSSWALVSPTAKTAATGALPATGSALASPTSASNVGTHRSDDKFKKGEKNDGQSTTGKHDASTAEGTRGADVDGAPSCGRAVCDVARTFSVHRWIDGTATPNTSYYCCVKAAAAAVTAAELEMLRREHAHRMEGSAGKDDGGAGRMSVDDARVCRDCAAKGPEWVAGGLRRRAGLISLVMNLRSKRDQKPKK